MLGSMKHVSLTRTGNVSMYDINPSHSWVLVFIDESGFVWLGDHLFPSAKDACRWGDYVKEELQLCEHYRTILLNKVLTSNSVANIIYRL